MKHSSDHNGIEPFTPRQQEVLDVTLSLLTKNATSITMNAIAQQASCSKETLYKWFGDRNGLLAATVQSQAAKVKVAPFDAKGMTRDSFEKILLGFAFDLLTTLTSQTSITLNRLAIAQAHQGEGDKNLGQIVLENGRFSTGPRLKPAIEAAMHNKILSPVDTENAFRCFYGLVVRDVHIRVLLGDTLSLTKTVLKQEAEAATKQFLSLFGTFEKTKP